MCTPPAQGNHPPNTNRLIWRVINIGMKIEGYVTNPEEGELTEDVNYCLQKLFAQILSADNCASSLSIKNPPDEGSTSGGQGSAGVWAPEVAV